MRRVLWLSILIGWIVPAMAAPIKPIPVQLHLLSIQLVNTTERHGDELYFNITEFRHDHSVNHFSVPELPSVWKSKDLAQVKPLILWQQSIEQGKPEELVVTLVEHDTPPWDVEDVLGEVKIHLRNNDGKLISNWVAQTTSDIKTIETPNGTIEHVKFSGNHGGYIVDFQMTTP